LVVARTFLPGTLDVVSVHDFCGYFLAFYFGDVVCFALQR
jgi:hypothetical protein